MVSIPAGFVVDLNTEGDGTTALGVRRALGVIVKQDTPGKPAAGRLGSDHCKVSGSSTSMAYYVSPGGLVLVRSATNGAYIVGIPEQLVVATSATNGINPRIDRIYAHQPDPGIDDTGTDPQVIVDVAVGTPAASPLAPAIPTGALELGRKRVAANATNTRTGDAFTNPAPLTTLNAHLPVVGLKRTQQTMRLKRLSHMVATFPGGSYAQMSGGMLNGTDSMTVPKDGLYRITASALTNGEDNGRYEVNITVNGDSTTYAQDRDVSPTDLGRRGVAHDTLALSAGDVIRMELFQTSSNDTGILNRYLAVEMILELGA